MSAFTALLDRLDDIQLARPLDAQPHEFSFFLRPLKELPSGSPSSSCSGGS